eukprot:scaffold261448_cov30-Tisochrysis_lutea.AAC.2
MLPWRRGAGRARPADDQNPPHPTTPQPCPLLASLAGAQLWRAALGRAIWLEDARRRRRGQQPAALRRRSLLCRLPMLSRGREGAAHTAGRGLPAARAYACSPAHARG